MRGPFTVLGLVASACLAGSACDAVLGLGDIEVPGAGGSAAAGQAGAGGGTGGVGNAGGAGGRTGGAGGDGGVMAVCGDGVVVKDAEQCDDSNRIDNDGCTACIIDAGYACSGQPSVCKETCGNGTLDLGEQCEDGNVNVGDGCNQGCLIEVGYECDNTTLPSQCHRSCGDGTLDPNEQCDLGGNDPYFGCNTDCTTTTGWACSQPDGNMMPSSCTVVCGDGVVVAGVETCDDANTVDGDGCSQDCSLIEKGWMCGPAGPLSCTGVCGDALAVGNEQCDDGNATPGDGCDGACKAESVCGNGIVDPTEQCDYKGMPAGCKPDCTLELNSVCGLANVIQGAAPDPMTGVRISYYENDSGASGVTVANTDVPVQSCHSFESPVLHRYTTGARPSIITVEALGKQADDTSTFDKTVVWAYRDCPNKSDLDGCADDGGVGSRSKLTTGYIPAQTTLFIVLAGEGAGDKGKYRLQVTEQPVKLFYYNSFPDQASPGLTDQLGDLISIDAGGDGSKWKNCMPGSGSNCDVVMNSHSGGAHAFADDKNDLMLTNIILQSNDVSTPGVAAKLFLQLDLRYTDAGGANEFVKVESSPDGLAWTALAAYAGISTESRVVLQPPLSAQLRFKITYNDGAKGVLPSSVDDIYLYGY